jgi:hypothetical protein
MTTDPLDAIVAEALESLRVIPTEGLDYTPEMRAAIRAAILADRERRGTDDQSWSEECDRLTKQRNYYHDEASHARATAIKFGATVEAMRAENKRLRDWMETYGDHLAECHTYHSEPFMGGACDCGYTDALAAADAPARPEGE